MNSFGKSKGGGRRSAERVPAPVLAVLSTVSHDHRAALVNISSIGARLSAPDLPAEGTDVIFRTGKICTFGQVVWAERGQCGVAFEGPLANSDVDRLRSEGNMWSLVGLSPEETAGAEQWELGVSR
jgi:PilZ domain